MRSGKLEIIPMSNTQKVHTVMDRDVKKAIQAISERSSVRQCEVINTILRNELVKLNECNKRTTTKYIR